MSYALDPELHAAVGAPPPVDLRDIPAARSAEAERLAAAPSPDCAGVRVRLVEVPRPQGPALALRVYTPVDHREAAAALPAVYDIHGGGFVLGSVAATHARSVGLCAKLRAVVVAVEYRLAPEHAYPLPLEDCYAGLVWTASHGGEYGIDPTRIALHGQSAGGGLAAALALLARDRGGPQPCFQYLGSPALDDRMSTASMRAFVDTPAWNRANARISWSSYLGEGVPGSEQVSPYAAPARATDLRGLPSAYVAAAQFDPLRDEAIAYALALQAAGVAVELHLFPGAFHGSVGVTSAEVSRREQAEEIQVLRRALHGPGAAEPGEGHGG
ncbi:alpha/beta hydrolase [Streptomyces sp. NPDC051784]|uniref:alpha/beta hydrolase n=1 Tax=Streptomyces sp. NPDC051784 TaxID=3155805 RepID=UPI003448D300